MKKGREQGKWAGGLGIGSYMFVAETDGARLLTKKVLYLL